jgi:hypothetical protein
MLLSDIEMMKMQACQLEMKAIVTAFRNALLKHFEVVNTNATRLINSRWGDDNV